jgi:peptidoglycan hydrolase-like protein with peptidoglycan-binding domain
MKILHFGVAIGLLAGLGACSDMMGNRSAPRSTAAATQPPVAPDMVRQVQSKLRDDGYYKQGPVDGVWGSGTENAVRTFQHDHNLISNGQLDVPTLSALNISTGTSTGTSATDNGNAVDQPANRTVPPATPTNTNASSPTDTTNGTAAPR